MDIEAEWIVDPIPNSTKCSICFDLMFDALMLPSCGHTFCGNCARGCLERQGTCPVCQRPSSASALVPNHSLRHVVGELRVRCPEEGCGEVVEVQNLHLHRRECVRRTSACSIGCGREMFNKEKATHNCVEYLQRECEDLRTEIERLGNEMKEKDREIASKIEQIARLDEELSFVVEKKDEVIAALREEVRSLQREFQEQHDKVLGIDMNQRFQDLPTTSLGGAASPAPLAAGTSGKAAFRFQELPKMEFRLKTSDFRGDEHNGEVQSNVVGAGGLRWWVSFWVPSGGPDRFLIHAEGDRAAPSSWTLTVQSLTVKFRGGPNHSAWSEQQPLTLRLEEATFSSDKGVVGMLPGRCWEELTNPSVGLRFFDPQGTLHLEVSFEGASMSPSPPPQRPTVWEAEATLQLRDFTSTLRKEDDRIFSPTISVGGVDWRVMAKSMGRGYYHFGFVCNIEEKKFWTRRLEEWSLTLLSAQESGFSRERRRDWDGVGRERPETSHLTIPPDIRSCLTGDIASVKVKICVRH